MGQYISKSAVVEEIERRLDYYKRNPGLVNAEYCIDEDIAILRFLDTLEVKEVDLKEKATQLSQKYFPNEENIWARVNIEAQKCECACIEMVEWLKTQKGE